MVRVRALSPCWDYVSPASVVGLAPDFDPRPLHTQANSLGCCPVERSGAAPRSRCQTNSGLSGWQRSLRLGRPRTGSWLWCASRLGDRSRPHAQSLRSGVPARGLAAPTTDAGGGMHQPKVVHCVLCMQEEASLLHSIHRQISCGRCVPRQPAAREPGVPRSRQPHCAADPQALKIAPCWSLFLTACGIGPRRRWRSAAGPFARMT